MKQIDYRNSFLVATVYLFSLSIIFFPLLSTGALVLFGLALWLNKAKLGSYYFTVPTAVIVGASILFALLYANSLLSGDFSRDAQFQFEKKLAYIFIPLLLAPISNKKLIITHFKQAWVYSIAVSLLICLLLAGYFSFINGNIDAFFYHELGRPFKLTATYFSFMISVAVFFLFASKDEIIHPKVKLLIYTLLLIGIFLLSSRMLQVALIIIFSVKWVLLPFKPNRLIAVFGILGIILLIAMNTNVGNRYKELFTNNIEVLQKTDVGRDYNFNGLNLRLFLWKCGLEILRENNLYYTGTGSSVAQKKLNEKIIKYNLYQGVKGTKDIGFLNYNFHNQYLETTIKTGIWGLLTLLLILIASFFNSEKELKYVIILSLFLLCTESMYEMQQGAVLSSFLIGLFVKNKDS